MFLCPSGEKATTQSGRPNGSVVHLGANVLGSCWAGPCWCGLLETPNLWHVTYTLTEFYAFSLYQLDWSKYFIINDVNEMDFLMSILVKIQKCSGLTVSAEYLLKNEPHRKNWTSLKKHPNYEHDDGVVYYMYKKTPQVKQFCLGPFFSTYQVGL